MFIIFPQDTCIFNFGAMTAIQLIALIQRRSMPERLSVIRTQFSIKHKKNTDRQQSLWKHYSRDTLKTML